MMAMKPDRVGSEPSAGTSGLIVCDSSGADASEAVAPVADASGADAPSAILESTLEPVLVPVTLVPLVGGRHAVSFSASLPLAKPMLAARECSRGSSARSRLNQVRPAPISGSDAARHGVGTLRENAVRAAAALCGMSVLHGDGDAPDQLPGDVAAGSPHLGRRGPTRPQFSVVLPTYNRVDIVMEAVESVIAQSFTDLELIIVDDRSTDATAALLARIGDPRVRLVTNEGGKGGAGARNYGISLARGEWVCFTDSDDLWDVRMLEHLAAGVERAGPQVGVVYGSDFSIDMETGTVRRRRVAELSGNAFPRMLERHFYHHCAAATRRVALESVGGYDENLGGMEDTDLQHRLTEAWEVLAVPEAIYYYRLGRSDQVTKDFGHRAVQMLLFLDKHDAVLRTMPRSMVKIAGVVMVTCLKGGRWTDAARLWGRIVCWGPAAPRLVWRYHLQSAVVLRDLFTRSLRRHVPAGLAARYAAATSGSEGRLDAAHGAHERTAGPV